jgi:hypothetical protein
MADIIEYFACPVSPKKHCYWRWRAGSEATYTPRRMFHVERWEGGDVDMACRLFMTICLCCNEHRGERIR